MEGNSECLFTVRYSQIRFLIFSEDDFGGSSFDLGFITNPKNGRVKGLNEVSLDRTYCFAMLPMTCFLLAV